MFNHIFKRIYNKNKAEKYLYISSSLKDTYVRGNNVIIGTNDAPYTVPLFQFRENLSRRTVRGTLPMRYKILEGVDGTPTEARIILRVPWGWSLERFQAEALCEWRKNPSVETVVSCHSAESVDMDLNFVTRQWRGDNNLRFADTEKRHER